jgi:fructan beta-fructosidase
MKSIIILFLFFSISSLFALDARREIKITQKYLNLPVQQSQERQEMAFAIDGDTVRKFVIRLSADQPDYWVFSDVSAFKGKTIAVTYPAKVAGLEKIYQADEIPGADSLYKEKNRPQFHFTSRRGWNNDPNGLVYYEGEYHLFYQHNPYEIYWGNMHWGHAVSDDLLHWKELGDALYPDELGTMFSGSAAIDHNNSSGFQTGSEKPLILAYTASSRERQVQCIAYSNDRGRTLTKYEGNPVIDSKERWNSRQTRDPKIFWHEATKKWIMALYEKDGHSIYTSDNLKNWTFQSHLGGFFECPELFELPVDGNKHVKKWVMYGASGTYMIGNFDGQHFEVESGKHRYVAGPLYAAQTYNDIPESDGRRIQIGWGRIPQPGMPFNQMMLFPTELTLRSTRNGIRMFSKPISEIEQLHHESHRWSNLSAEEANVQLKEVEGDLFHIKMKVEIMAGTSFAFHLNGNSIADFTMNHNKLNGEFYDGDAIENMTISLELLIDRTSIELFADNGQFTVIAARSDPQNDNGLEFASGRSEIKVHHLEVHELKSIWQKK